MGELRAYTCDGGCLAHIVLDRPHDGLASKGWFHTFPPDGGALQTCSPVCTIRALAKRYPDETRAIRRRSE